MHSYTGQRRGSTSRTRYSSHRGNQNRRRNNRPSNSGGRGGRNKYINPEKFINKAKPIKEVAEYEPDNLFADFAFVSELHKNIRDQGFDQPTPIQDQAIPHALAGKDIVGLANTGTGKTAAFVLPIINRLTKNHGRKPALIITPTRELAHQIEQEFKLFSKGIKLFSVTCVGGEPIGRQINQIERGVDLIIGTPGRLNDLIKRRKLRLDTTEILVLDEADQMLDMGFINDIQSIVSNLPHKRQILCFSATMTPAVDKLLADLLHEPVNISVKKRSTNEHTEQDIVKVASYEKLEALTKILEKPEFERILVFAETKRNVQKLADELSKQGFNAVSIHGNKTQPQRRKALEAFKSNRAQILCATDVAARGLDIPDVSLVINYEVPGNYETYVHRIGRTGRAGKAGHALTFI